MTDTPKQDKPVGDKLLDALCRALGIYERASIDAPNADYNTAWFFSPLKSSETALKSKAQKPIKDALAAVLTRPKPDSPLFLVHKKLPFALRVRDTGSPVQLDVGAVAWLPADASLDPTADKQPKFFVEAQIARMVTGDKVADLASPVSLGAELRLADKPKPGVTPTKFPLLAAIALRVGLDAEPDVTARLTDAREQGRDVTWSAGQSPIVPLIRIALLVLRAWVVQKCEQTAKPAAPAAPPAAWRVHDHLFPLLEGQKNGQLELLPAFPIADVGVHGGDALGPYLKKFLTPAAIVMVLYHLRALITGKETLGTAPGSAIAWFRGDAPADASHLAPQDKDFGLVVRTLGDEKSGSLALGLRGQLTRVTGDIRVGLALEGDLARATWKNIPTDIAAIDRQNPAKVGVSTGHAALLLVVEPKNPDGTLIAVSGVGAVKRVELGVEYRIPSAAPRLQVRVTAIPDGQLAARVDSLLDAAADVEAAVKARLRAALAQLPAVPTELRDAALDAIDGKIGPAALAARAIAWMKGQVPSDIGVGFDLGFAALAIDAAANGSTYSAGLTVDTAKFAPGLPVRLADGTSVAVTDAGITLKTGLELALDTDLPWRPAVTASLSGGNLKLALELRPKAGGPPIAFSLLPPFPQVAEILQHAVYPLIDLAIKAAPPPPVDAAKLLNSLTRDTNGNFALPTPAAAARAVLDVLGPALKGVASDVPFTFDLARAELAFTGLSLGSGGITLSLGKLALALLGPGPELKIEPTLKLDDLKLTAAGEQGAPLYAGEVASIGKLVAGTSVDVFPPALRDISLEVHDVRLPLGRGGDAGLLSPGKDNPGIGLALGWRAVGSPQGFYAKFLDGKAELALTIDRVIGPIDLKRLIASLKETTRPGTTDKSAELGLELDGEFKLGGVRVAPQGLRLDIPLEHIAKPSEWKAGLDGLAISYKEGGVALAGMLARTPTGFTGQAAMTAFGFQLGVLAAYEKLAQDGSASLVVFGVLNVTLGGPPFFVVTGVAAGFGVNRALERPKKTADLQHNVLLKTMRGQAITARQFGEQLTGKPGAYWLAAGVKFVSYGFINGDALLYVLFDQGFELGLIALAGMKIPALAAINLAIEAGLSTRGEPTLYAKAALYESWLLHEDCKLTGGFALQVWPRKGDAVITLGGYHPAFKRPDDYPEVDRIGFRWQLGDAISIKGSCYFAMTPREAMGGGRLEVEGRWGPLSAGFHAGVDGLIRWDPFYFDVLIEVGVWCAIETWLGTLRLSLGVGLHVWGPEVGGVASIDIAVISIDIPFGEPMLGTPALPVARFLRDHLQVAVPGDDAAAETVRWGPGSLGDKAPLRVSVASGRAPGPDGPAGTLRLQLEFAVRVGAAIPLTEIARSNAAPQPCPNDAAIHFALSKKTVQRSALTFTTPNPAPKLVPLKDDVPLALFGPHEAYKGNSSKMTVGLTTAALYDGTAERVGGLVIEPLDREQVDVSEWCPLPLGRAASTPLARLAAKLSTSEPWQLEALAAVAPVLANRLKAGGRALPRRHAPLARVAPATAAYSYRGNPGRKKRAAGPPHAVEALPQLLELAFLRLPPGTGSLAARTTVAPALAGLPRIAPPTAPLRSPLVAGVALQVVTARTPPAAPPPRHTATPPRTRSGKHARAVLAPPGPARRAHHVLDRHAFVEADEAPALLHTGEACVLDLARPDARRPPRYRLQLDGGQHVRVVALDLGGRPLADLELPPGHHDMVVPPGSHRLALFGHGLESFVTAGPRQYIKDVPPPPPPAPREPAAVGFTPTTAVLGAGEGVFVGPGCVARTLAGAAPRVTPLCLQPAAKVLAPATRVLLHFAPRAEGLLGVRVTGLRDVDLARALTVTAGAQRLPLREALVRGDAALLAFAAATEGPLQIDLPDALHLAGAVFWPARTAAPTTGLDLPLAHPVRPHAAATSFRLEVSR